MQIKNLFSENISQVNYTHKLIFLIEMTRHTRFREETASATFLSQLALNSLREVAHWESLKLFLPKGLSYIV